MSSEETNTLKRGDTGWAPIRRFLPYLWPAGHPGLKARVIFAVVLVFIAKAATLTMPFAYKAAIDRMTAGREAEAMLAIALVVAYAGARFGGVLFDNLRNVRRAHLRVPNTIGIDHHCRTDRTKPNRSALRQHHFPIGTTTLRHFPIL